MDKINTSRYTACQTHPERFNYKQPQLKKIPKAVYINPPESVEKTNKSRQQKGAMAS
jgi:hypothetical protein